MGRKQFTFYRSFYEAVMKLPEEERGGGLTAIVEYALDKVRPRELTVMQDLMFGLIKPTLDSAWKKAESGTIGKRGPAEKNNKGEKEIEKENEKEIETEAEAEGFLRFWERYPKKLGREEAMAQWERVCEDQEMILSGLENWRRSESWKRENGRFVPKPGKWLRERWWEQTPEMGIPKGASGVLGKAEREAIERLFET